MNRKRVSVVTDYLLKEVLDWHQVLDQNLTKVVHAAFSIALTLKIYGGLRLDRETDFESYFLKVRGYPKAYLEWLDEFLKIAGHFNYDRSTAKWLRKIGYRLPSTVVIREIMDQIEEYRSNGLVIGSPHDLFMVARYEAWHGTKSSPTSQSSDHGSY